MHMLLNTVASSSLTPLLLREPLPFFSDDRLITWALIFYIVATRLDPYVVRILKTVSSVSPQSS